MNMLKRASECCPFLRKIPAMMKIIYLPTEVFCEVDGSYFSRHGDFHLAALFRYAENKTNEIHIIYYLQKRTHPKHKNKKFITSCHTSIYNYQCPAMASKLPNKVFVLKNFIQKLIIIIGDEKASLRAK